MINITTLIYWAFYAGSIYNYFVPQNPYSGNIIFAQHLLEIYFWFVLLGLGFFRIMLVNPSAKITVIKKLGNNETFFNPHWTTKFYGYFKQSISLAMIAFYAIVLGKFRLAFLFLSQLLLAKSLYEKAKEIIKI